jgi:polysaccharide deacetylase family protein (PEP-CTERM system associated)
MITFTIDLEDHLERYETSGRWVVNTYKILDFCAATGIRATFFTVGRVATATPTLLKEIAGAGHELALHSHDHVALTQENPHSFPVKLDVAKKTFEDLTGKPVQGFRAPKFSLTPKSAWVIEVLQRLGFSYSSSIIPGHGAFHGFPEAPVTPFLWREGGLIELPVPVARFGPAALPFLGGVYLRYLPLAWVLGFVGSGVRGYKKNDPRTLEPLEPKNPPVLWTYVHPYDIDGEEGFVRLQDGTPLWANALLMLGRGGFLKKLETLLKGQAGAPLAHLAQQLKAQKLPVFSGRD